MALRLYRAVVGQEDALRAALDDGWRDRGAGDVGKALRREQPRDILLAKHLEPFADARGEQRMVEEDPGFVEDQQRRPSVEPLFPPVEQIGAQRRARLHLAQQRPDLAPLNTRKPEI